MKIVLFYHSLISDWNHGNAHFLRGIYASLLKLGHDVTVYEPKDGWSLSSLIKDAGPGVVDDFRAYFPHLEPTFYDPGNYNLRLMLEDADMVIVHEWNDPGLVKAIGDYKLVEDFVLLFHDTHHRAVSAKEEMKRYDLSNYDGVLAFGNTLRKEYLREGWHQNVWTWHEAADTDTYHPMVRDEILGDVVWVGNWGDDERTEEIHEFIIEPVKKLGLKARFYGVRYPQHAIKALEEAGIEYGGWLPTCRVAETFSKYRATIHVPRRFYRQHLHGIPTIRPFEAMATKIPLLSAPWEDTEGLFTSGQDFLMARNGQEMTRLLDQVISDKKFATEMTNHAYSTICARHTCQHRVTELMDIYAQIVDYNKVEREAKKYA